MTRDGDGLPRSKNQVLDIDPTASSMVDRPHVNTLVTQFAPEEEEVGGEELQAIITVLTGADTGTVHHLDRPQTFVGRDNEATIALNDPGLSRIHARFVRKGSMMFVEDLNSTNGTLVNGQRIDRPQRLTTGDRVQIGQRTVLRFAFQDRLEQEAHQRVYEMTVRDALTQLHNRRYLDERIESEFAYSVRHKTPLCILMLDVDHFKHVNDTFGHSVGDQVLCAVARALENTIRTEDLVARYGGEEFVIVARGIDSDGATTFAERVRTYLANMQIQTDSGKLCVTASFGVAHMDARPYASAYGLLSAADEALYRAKRNGRNRVEFADSPDNAHLAETADWKRQRRETRDSQSQ